MAARRRETDRGRARGNAFVAACTAVAVAVSLVLIRDIWADGIPLGSDMGAHVVRADHAITHFFSKGRLDGWQDRFGLGYQQSLFLGPGFNLLVWLLTLLSLGSWTTVTAVKAAIVVSYAALPPAVAFLAWSFGLGRRSIGVAAILSLGVTVSLGGAGMAGLFTWALVPNSLGAVFTVLGAGGIALVVREPSVPRVLLSAACLALVILTHPWAAIVLVLFTVCFGVSVGLDWALAECAALRPAVLWRMVRALLRPSPDEPVVLVADTRWRDLLRGPARRLRALALTAALGVALAGVQVIPLLTHRDLKGENATFADVASGERLADALRGADLLRPYLMILVIAGLAWAALLAMARRPLALPLVLTPLLTLASARAGARLFPHNVIANQLTNRSMFFVGILGMLAAASLVGEIGPTLASLRTALGYTPSRPRPGLRLVPAVALAALPLAVILVPAPPPAERAGTVTPTPALLHAAGELRQRVPDSGRYLVQLSDRYDKERGGIWQPQYWLAWASGRDSLNSFNLESSVVADPLFEGEHLTERSPEAEAAALARYGVTHVLLFEPEKVQGLLAGPRVAVVWSEGGIALAEVRTPDGVVSPVPVVATDESVQGRVVDADPEHLVADVTGSGPRLATLAVAYSPKWRATVNGEPVPLQRDAGNQLAVMLPAGPARLELVYGSDLADALGLAVTLAALVLGALLGTRRHRRPARRLPPLVGAVDRLVAAIEAAPPSGADPDRWPLPGDPGELPPWPGDDLATGDDPRVDEPVHVPG